MLRILTTSLFLIINAIAFGQVVKISYSEIMETDTPTQLSIQLDQKTYLKIVARADFSAKKEFVLSHYKCQDGVVSKTDLSNLPIEPSVSLNGRDSLALELMMQQVKDSVCIAFAIDGKPYDLVIPRNYVVPFQDGGQQRYLLMETILDTPVTIEDEISLFAVSSGITQRIQLGENKMLLQDFCGIRVN